jgi:hypothetical protein
MSWHFFTLESGNLCIGICEIKVKGKRSKVKGFRKEFGISRISHGARWMRIGHRVFVQFVISIFDKVPGYIGSRSKRNTKSSRHTWSIDLITCWATNSSVACNARKLLENAGPFKVSRPPRQPVSLRLDPFDISMIKRIARNKGIPHTQLMVLWLHEKVAQEREGSFSPWGEPILNQCWLAAGFIPANTATSIYLRISK